MSKEIIFTNTTAFEDLEQPQPASKFIPDWYKNLESYIGGEKKPQGNGVTAVTAKRCMPLFDAITAGYIITLPADVYVSIKDATCTIKVSGPKKIKILLCKDVIQNQIRTKLKLTNLVL